MFETEQELKFDEELPTFGSMANDPRLRLAQLSVSDETTPGADPLNDPAFVKCFYTSKNIQVVDTNEDEDE